jgi:SAM-dependent methyltransferase
MFNSAKYWERRYKRGKDSGSGSYGRLARFKAEVVNRVIAETKATSLLDLGCGDGHQLSLFRPMTYVGVEVSPTILGRLRNRYAGQPTFRFLHEDELPLGLQCDIALSCDVIFHLLEDAVFEAHMTSLFRHARHVVVIYSSNHDEPYDGSHVRRRRFTDFVAARFPEWSPVLHIPNAFPWDPTRPSETSSSEFHIYTAPATAG